MFEKHGRYLKNPKSGAKLQLHGATVKGVQATEVELHGASFMQVTFQNCSFWRTDFTEVSFELADMTNCVFDGSSMQRAVLRGARLKGHFKGQLQENRSHRCGCQPGAD